MAVAASCLVAACASTPEATPERDAEAKRFESDLRFAVIYIYRPEPAGSAPAATLFADGRIVGDSLPATFFRVIAQPGRNRLEGTAGDIGHIEINTHPGGVYYVQMLVPGDAEQSPQSVFTAVPAEQAQAIIRRCCNLLETWRTGQPRLLW
jgi:hypothetical protein